MNMDIYSAASILSKADEWSKWINEIPEINFPHHWGVQIIPPFGRAIARFRIKKGNRSISVYLDCYDHLGCFGEPYWEIYPFNDDIYRVPMEETEELIKKISEELGE